MSASTQELVRAASIRAFGEGLEVAEIAAAPPGEGEIAVAVRAVGLCGTDLKIKSGVFNLTLPLVPGHEIAGDVVAVGAGVDPGRIGERVACYYYRSCGSCIHCANGQENLCSSVRRLGFECDGGLSERLICSSEVALPLPDGVSYDLGAVAMDALTTPLRGLSGLVGLQPGQSLLVVGAGGLGLNAVQVGRSLGARVGVCEPVRARRELALERGAEFAAAPDDLSSVAAWAGYPPDVVAEMSGTQAGLDLAARVVRPGGQLAVFGYDAKSSLCLDTPRLVLDEIKIRGIRGGSLEMARRALALLGSKELSADIADRYRLSEVNDAYVALQEGGKPGRIIVAPSE